MRRAPSRIGHLGHLCNPTLPRCSCHAAYRNTAAAIASARSTANPHANERAERVPDRRISMWLPTRSLMGHCRVLRKCSAAPASTQKYSQVLCGPASTQRYSLSGRCLPCCIAHESGCGCSIPVCYDRANTAAGPVAGALASLVHRRYPSRSARTVSHPPLPPPPPASTRARRTLTRER